MNKIKLFILFVVCCSTLLTTSGYSQTSPTEESEIQTTSNTCTITKVTYIPDECEPEMVLTLDNDIRLLSKWHGGLFYAGQRVSVFFEQNKFKLVLISFHADGSESGQETFYRIDETSHFYYQG